MAPRLASCPETELSDTGTVSYSSPCLPGNWRDSRRGSVRRAVSQGQTACSFGSRTLGCLHTGRQSVPWRRSGSQPDLKGPEPAAGSAGAVRGWRAGACVLEQRWAADRSQSLESVRLSV